ncbi:multiple sugar transport system ATP-binding protein [Haladaptatus litoreus]|uniref:ABC-type D-xylose/L-arabinose transporter n=1 Tax=Haladaptatus litoreus TaxID=553468 RepID=A0A1N7EKT5_9EURY|nr:ABC transporter ATP-binding protein [Haladaptatus litoreus]SIR88710.1 multiple sugar transport system ATP-binding protein [Haladaptatus litoreus]
MGILRIDRLVKSFTTADSVNEVIAVDNLDITVEEGEFLVLLGPSGCGKSTTLRCIAGLETPTSGSIRLDETNITDNSPQQRDMAMVFQDFALYPHMTAAENMSFGLKMTTDLSEEERTSRVHEAATIMDIEGILDKKPAQVSGGQKQRIALGRAIVRDPEVFLMDEPLSNLDAKLRAQMRTEIQRLHRKLGVTTIYVTHDQTEAMTMSDRIAVMNNGELQQIGTPDYVYHHPVNQFVAGFLGEPSMNFLAVRLSETDGQYVLTDDDDDPTFAYPIDESIVQGCDLTIGQRLTVGVRPEDISVADDEGTNNHMQTAMLDVVEPMGSDDFLYLLVGQNSWTARVDEDLNLTEGEQIAYFFEESNLHLFADDGTTLKSAGLGEDAFHIGSDHEITVEATQSADSQA